MTVQFLLEPRNRQSTKASSPSNCVPSLIQYKVFVESFCLFPYQPYCIYLKVNCLFEPIYTILQRHSFFITYTSRYHILHIDMAAYSSFLCFSLCLMVLCHGTFAQFAFLVVKVRGRARAVLQDLEDASLTGLMH